MKAAISSAWEIRNRTSCRALKPQGEVDGEPLIGPSRRGYHLHHSEGLKIDLMPERTSQLSVPDLFMEVSPDRCFYRVNAGEMRLSLRQYQELVKPRR